MNVITAVSIDEAMSRARSLSDISQIFILGGENVYQVAIEKGYCDAVFVTHLVEHPPMPCDVFFPRELLSIYKDKINITKLAFDHVNVSSKAIELVEGGNQVREGDIRYEILGYCNPK